MEKLIISDDQVRLFARRKEDEKFQQIFYVKYKLGEFIYLLDIIISVCDKIFTNKPFCIVLKKVFAINYTLSIFF